MSNLPPVFSKDSDRRKAMPKIGALKNSPQLGSLVSKLVYANREVQTGGMFRRREVNLPGDQFFTKLSDNTATNVTDSANLMQLLPDLRLNMQIMVSSILSPKDMINAKLNYRVQDGIFDSELSGLLLDVVSTHFSQVYKMDSRLPTLLEDILYHRGSRPMIILSESTIDDVINNPTRTSMESVKAAVEGVDGNCLGWLGQPKDAAGDAAKGTATAAGVGFALESFSGGGQHANQSYNPVFRPFGESNAAKAGRLLITDNPEMLKMPALAQAAIHHRSDAILKRRNNRKGLLNLPKVTVATESLDADGRPTLMEVQSALYTQRRYASMPVQTLYTRDQLKSKTKGHPLVIEAPSEAVIPVFVPSDPSDHIGYFLVCDEQGHLVNKATQDDYYGQLNQNVNANNDMISQLIQSTHRGTYGMKGNNEIDGESLQRAYTDMVEQNVLARLRAGAAGANVTIARPEEVYRIMLARTLANQDTRLLYVPAEMVTYFAIDYNKFGIGRSLLEDTKILGGMRAILMFANTMGSLRNSVGRTKLNIKLDERDDDPVDTVEFIIGEFSKNRQQAYPLGASNPLDIISFLQNAGVEVVVSGNDGYPNTEVNAEDFAASVNKPDLDLDNLLRKNHSLSLGIPVEMVDNAQGPEFATTAVTNNLLLTKRVMKTQEQFCPHVTDFVQKYTYNSGTLLDRLRKIIIENKGKLGDEVRQYIQTHGQELNVDNVVKLFIDSIICELPSPDTTKVKVQIDAYKEYREALDEVLPAYISKEMFDGGGDQNTDISSAVEGLVALTKAHYLRQYLRTNNIMPELFELMELDEKGVSKVNIFDSTHDHMKTLYKVFGKYMDKIKKLVEAREPQDETPPDDDGAGPGADDGMGTDTDEFGTDTENPDETQDTGEEEQTDTGEEEEEQEEEEQTETGEDEAAADTGAEEETGEEASTESIADLYQEADDRTYFYEAVSRPINPLLRAAHSIEPESVEVKDLRFNLQQAGSLSPRLVSRADYSYPLVGVREEDGRVVILDGMKRLARANADGAFRLPVKIVSMEQAKPN